MIRELADREQRERAEVSVVQQTAVASVDPVTEVDELDVAVRTDRTRGVGWREVGFRLAVPRRAGRRAGRGRRGDHEGYRRRVRRTRRVLAGDRERRRT